ncbi:MAG: HNH endonuclease [Planctomycetes bacterium]|nr:HNH endonuclease [Planctomycetota bacterium]
MTSKPLSWYRDVYIKEGYRCVYCGRDMLRDFDAWMSIEVDHVIPVSAGGSDDLDNRVASCNVCNWLKGRFVVDGHADMALEEVLEHARQHVAKKRGEWQSRFILAIREFREGRD